ncbi:hypothetical protein BBBOND_0206070 [Babesia bigemina]|uniref:Uncharacterized protein n=1 Tax=Babesia bigemina TaxID=5866 RepID=A0A061D966_BABBI|nr:hypothetical protein BBBOND_0206070 [Babesia bigemina]CDR95449.1 hypothetical protein BBBOND_0206070 [Babesia bigemina]|eukprot:XP_012767635.1 hypothetical protein BBBOND_0206070 [Babesia bigemina]
MKCVLSLAILAISQIRLIAAAPQQEAGREAQQQAVEASAKVQDIKYTDIFTSTEKRFTVVMKLMKDDGFKAELLTAVHGAISRSSNDLFQKWAEVLSAAYPQRFEGAVARSTLPSWLKSTAVKTNSDQANKVKEALTEVGKSVHTLLTQLFGEYAKKIETEKAEVPQGAASGVAGSSTGLALTQAAANTSDNDDLLNLRFVMTPFKDDLYALYNSIKDMPTSNDNDKTAIKTKVMEWVKEKVPSVEPIEAIDGHAVQGQLKKIIVTDTHLTDSVISIESYNQMDTDLTEAFEKCKNMNAASFGTIGLLLAAVLAFTMW